MIGARDAASAYWTAYAESFVQPLRANGLISRFVTNPAVTGAYAEAWVRLITHRMLGLKYRISTGAVVSPADASRGGLDKVPQCDLIIWDPSVLPGLFEAGDFALVPFASAKATIEIKRSVPSLAEFREQLGRQSRVTPNRRTFGVAVSFSRSLFDLDCTPDWLNYADDQPRMTRLMDKRNKPDQNGIMAFIYFLSQIAGHDETIIA